MIGLFNNSVRTSKKTQPVKFTNANLLKLFKKIFSVYTENYSQPIKQNAELLNVKVAGAYSYQRDLKG
jgi:hypothetical protein